VNKKVFKSHLLTSFSNKNPLTLLAEHVETEPMTVQQLTRNPENSKLVESKQPTSGKIIEGRKCLSRAWNKTSIKISSLWDLKYYSWPRY
jgi:hypothetical protein